MNNELLTIFDEHRNRIGTATREEVHKMGHWHETFHCWFINNHEGMYYIYFQLRSARKKDYPNLLDITAAGHLLSHETMADGVREVKEETGIAVSMSELVQLGVIDYSNTREEINFIDNELAHVCLYEGKFCFEDFNVQTEEVSGIFRAPFNQFYDLWLGGRDKIFIEGFEINDSGEKTFINKMIGKDKFVPHEMNYYQSILDAISHYINR